MHAPFSQPLINAFAALAYFASAWLGNLLSSAAGGVSPLWPASGIALALTMVCGRGILPGLFLGSFTSYFVSGTEWPLTIEQALLGAMATATAACAQVWLGMLAINRWIGKQNPLIEDRSIFLFFLIGIASCLLSAMVNAAVMFNHGGIDAENLFDTVIQTWVGNAIGTAIFAPMSLLFIGKPEAVWHGRRQAVLYPLLLTLLATILAFKFSQRQESERLHNLLERQTDLLHTALYQRLNLNLAGAKALKAFFDSSVIVTPDEFVRFAQSIGNQCDGLLEWIPKISHPERKPWEQAHGTVIRYADFEYEMFVPAGDKTDYFPVEIAVKNTIDPSGIGYDISNNPQVAETLNSIVEQNQPLVVSETRLQANHRPYLATVIYAPVFKQQEHELTSPDHKRQALLGFVANGFRLDAQIAEIYRLFGDNELQISITLYQQQRVLFSNVVPGPYPYQHQPELGSERTLNFAGSAWRLHAVPSSDFYAYQQSPLSAWLLGGGLLLSSLISLGLLLVTGRTTQVENLIAERTSALQRINDTLNHEISTRLHQEEELRVAATTFESHEAIVVTSPDGTILRVNKAFSTITGYSADEVIGDNPRLLASGFHDAEFFRAMYAALEQTNQWEGEIWNRRKNGEVYPEWLTLTGVRDEAGHLSHYVGIFSDISEQKAKEQEILNLAYYDPLTGLANRRMLLDRLSQEIAAAKRQHMFGALFFLDLDHFKILNDSRGHQVGDELLIQMAQRLKATIRREDSACRLGGDEFIVMVPARYHSLRQANQHAAILADKILQTINQPFIVQGSEHHFSTSIGVSLYPQGDEKPEQIIQQADTAMYRAKENGRNRIRFYEPEMQTAANKRLTLEKELRLALKHQQFKLVYQPQVDESGNILSAEALIRWQHPQKGSISPADFIPLAEDTQLILPLGSWVLQEACRQIKRWDLLGRSIGHVAVNVSSRQFRQSGFVQQIQHALRAAGIDPHRLVVELTEGSVIENIDDTVAKMQALQAMGVRISIDDFGVGYSSLSYLQSLPLSQLKIDKSFVSRLGESNAEVITETIIMMAKSLGLGVIAEGVETSAQVEFLLSKGCTSFQGYFFFTPVPAEEFPVHLLSSNHSQA
ncbi:EAL domain-containing protein [Methylomonas sp. HYX-M1]|uniref:EAL domain-containing protein n=1 Tax=Methylomonas sp. HYX-M1 TaxID=3139307 RepID=UPI00345BEACC